MRDKIIDLLKNNPYDVSDIAKYLKIRSGYDFTELNKTVNEMLEEGICFEDEGKIHLAKMYLKGTVHYKNGYAFVDNMEIANDTGYGLLDGDEIYYRLFKRSAECVHVLSRKTTYVYGTMIFRQGCLYFFSDEKVFSSYNVVNLNEYRHSLKENYRVRTYISDYRFKELKIDKVLGPGNNEETLIESILLKNSVITSFPKAVLKEIEKIDDTVELGDRKDLRDLPIITIDGDDAKDFDDAICVIRKEDGYELYVSIADVSHYVKEDTELDKSAYLRGTSIYYPGHVIPMLPDILCNNLCSLKEKVDRYTITCRMHIDYEGTVLDYDIYPSLINSKHRMTYKSVNKIINHDAEECDKYSDITSMIYTAYELSRIINKKRREKGGIEFDSNEPVIVEEDGKVVDIRQRIQDKAEILIEDFMIIANETVATHMFYLDLPLIYRNHDYPKSERIEKFVEMMENLNYTFKGNIYEMRSTQLQKCLEEFEGKPEFSVVSETMLRTMSKAVYSSTSDIHYGLGLEHYCHFTSPIRRYPDLIVHRMLHKYVFSSDNYNDIETDNVRNGYMSEKCNENEKKAVQVERDILDLKKAEYMLDKKGMSFIGVISSTVPFGFFVRLENTVEGLVHKTSLSEGFYLDNNDVFTDGNSEFHIGDKVKVKLNEVDLIRRNIDFVLVKKLNRDD
ncbi:MAG: ribonuclease R [Erysipelotrichaceae bacterium]|nr:ribonuclease R [Erysipelotrichaceae bacterium]